MLQIARMPMIRFYREAVPRRDAAGHTTYVDVDYAEVTAAGGRDSTIKVVKEWLPILRDASHMRNGFDVGSSAYDQWHDKIKAGYDRWLLTEEMPVDGTSIKAIRAFTPSEIQNCLQANMTTLEDLADASEEAMGRIGINARALKNKAIKIIEANKNNGVAEENTALKERLIDVETKMAQLLESGLKLPQANQRKAA